MKNTLHILNGDCTKDNFRLAEIEGATMVWRETLVLGPLFYQVDSELFWEMRSQFIEKAYDSKLAEYRAKVILEFHKLRKFQGEEIILWFEYDLFCQVNMVALLSYLLRYKSDIRISLVCVGDLPGYNNRVTLGELPSEVYPDLLDTRLELTRDDLLTADRAWMLFCGGKINTPLEELQEFHPFPYLREAMINFQEAFYSDHPDRKLEFQIKNLMKAENYNKDKVVHHFLRNKKELGLGDRQYEYLIDSLI